MPELPVSALMTRALASVGLDTPAKHVVGMLVAHDVRALPVIDHLGRPVGVISDVDTLSTIHRRSGRPNGLLRRAGFQARVSRRDSEAVVASELMRAPAPTVLDSAPVGVATQRLITAGIGALFVVNSSDCLIGVLTARDALRPLLRRDPEIHAEIEHVVASAAPSEYGIEVSVRDGEVRLHGCLGLHSTAAQIECAVLRIRGVLAVHNAIRYEVDDMLITGF
ncbi:CBS domain-containing protein [Pseudonocardia parietis]|uniref:CBS domain-containing protein n=1 Tax=Pseudonocardia parietis TaxID=570936 RepID=A0ABS4VLV3_9PSEU|nr:CBS domain-containing protein [Pseudonocardia parietis]MBP2364896.1 CBS domain-containing protein [Pseudonocardia parietis]